MNIGDGILPIISDSKQRSNTVILDSPSKKDKSSEPSNKLGLAIIECMDQCNIGLVQLSELLEEVSSKKANEVINIVINIPPTTLHSYTLPGSKREIRKYPLDTVLNALKAIMELHGTGHPKWINKLIVQKDIKSWLQHSFITPKYINSITGLTEQIIGRYSRGLYDVNYEKWSLVRSQMKSALEANKINES